MSCPRLELCSLWTNSHRAITLKPAAVPATVLTAPGSPLHVKQAAGVKERCAASMSHKETRLKTPAGLRRFLWLTAPSSPRMSSLTLTKNHASIYVCILVTVLAHLSHDTLLIGLPVSSKSRHH